MPFSIVSLSFGVIRSDIPETDESDDRNYNQLDDCLPCEDEDNAPLPCEDQEDETEPPCSDETTSTEDVIETTTTAPCTSEYDPWCACRVPGDCDEYGNYCLFGQSGGKRFWNHIVQKTHILLIFYYIQGGMSSYITNHAVK